MIDNEKPKEISESGPRPIGQTSWDVQRVIERGARAEIGELIRYSEWSEILGRNVQGKGRSALHSARNILQRDHQIVFGVVLNIGLKRLSSPEVVHTSQAHVDHIRRTAKRGGKRLVAGAEYTALANPDRTKFNLYVSAFGAMTHFTSGPAMKKIEAAVEQCNSTLIAQKTLDALRGAEE